MLWTIRPGNPKSPERLQSGARASGYKVALEPLADSRPKPLHSHSIRQPQRAPYEIPKALCQKLLPATGRAESAPRGNWSPVSCRALGSGARDEMQSVSLRALVGWWLQGPSDIPKINWNAPGLAIAPFCSPLLSSPLLSSPLLSSPLLSSPLLSSPLLSSPLLSSPLLSSPLLSSPLLSSPLLSSPLLSSPLLSSPLLSSPLLSSPLLSSPLLSSPLLSSPLPLLSSPLLSSPLLSSPLLSSPLLSSPLLSSPLLSSPLLSSATRAGPVWSPHKVPLEPLADSRPRPLHSHSIGEEK